MKVGFIGLGHMGAPMAANLLGAGVEVAAFDINEHALNDAVCLGAVAASSPADAAAGADFVITVLPSPEHVRRVYLDKDGVMDGASPNAILLDCSTVDPETSQRLIQIAAGRGLTMADAPISGGVMGARNATLSFMVGGDEALLARVTPMLNHMGKNVIHCGGPGNGQVVKICNNLLLAISMAGTSEVMALGVKLGVEADVLARAINASSGRCFSSEHYNPWPGVCPDAPASHDYAPGGTAEILLKDVSFAVDAAHRVRQPAMLGAVTQQLYHMLVKNGYGEKDLSSVVKLYCEAK